MGIWNAANILCSANKLNYSDALESEVCRAISMLMSPTSTLLLYEVSLQSNLSNDLKKSVTTFFYPGAPYIASITVPPHNNIYFISRQLASIKVGSSTLNLQIQ